MEEFEQPEFHTAKTISDYHITHLDLHALETVSQDHSALHDRSQIDRLLDTSFVELDQLPPIQDKQNLTSYSSGDNFFLKTNSLFFSSRGMAHKKLFNHKKVQCSIGTGNSSINCEVPETLYGKQKRLQILKMIKLLRVIFKQIKLQRDLIREEIQINQQKNQKLLQTVSNKWCQVMSEYSGKMVEKDLKLVQLEQCLRHVLEQNQKLKGDLQVQTELSCKKMKDLQEQNWNSLSEINEQVSVKKDKINQLTDKVEALEAETAYLSQEVNNLNDILQAKHTSIERFEYERNKLEVENRELANRIQELQKRYAQTEYKYTEQCETLQANTAKMNQALRLNGLYQDEIASCKEQISSLIQQQERIKTDLEDHMNEELKRYQEYFNQEVAKIRQDYNRKIFDKNSLIEKYQAKQKVYQQIITNNKQMMDLLPLRVNHKSQKHINKIKSLEKLCNGLAGKENKRELVIKINSKFSNRQSQLTTKTDSQIYPDNCAKPTLKKYKHAKFRSWIQEPDTVPTEELVFKAPTHSKHQIKLSSYLKSPQQQFSATDGMWVSKKNERDDMRLSKLANTINSNIDEYVQWKRCYS